MSAADVPGFVCPRCRGAVRRDASAYRCEPCGAVYPVVLGIPDFRVFPDPWIGFAEDRDKAERLERASAGQDFEATVRAYWAMTPETPPALAERFIGHVLAAEARAADWLAWIDGVETAPPAGPWLDVGCGTADLVAAVAGREVAVVGIDIAMRWLVAARKRPSLAGRHWLLVCCNGEYLPFPDASFGRVLSRGTLEHCREAERVVAEGRRVLAAGGVMRAATVNRFTLLREPHVRLWGVGFVPRRWADAFVRWRTGRRYLHHKPLSAREVARAFRRAGFRDVVVGAGPLLRADRARLRVPWRSMAAVYDALRRVPVVRGGLGWIAPELDARGLAA